MDYEAILSKVTESISKFIDAASPIAQKAYEIGLLTLRIDAAQRLLLAFVVFGILFYLNKKLSDHKKDCVALLNSDAKPTHRSILSDRGWTWYSEFDEIGYVLSKLLVYTGMFLICIFNILNVWLWIKLFNPELWLAKTAIEAVIQGLAK